MSGAYKTSDIPTRLKKKLKTITLTEQARDGKFENKNVFQRY